MSALRVLTAVALVATPTGLAAQTVEPDYTGDQIVEAFTCKADDFIQDAEGKCYQQGECADNEYWHEQDGKCYVRSRGWGIINSGPAASSNAQTDNTRRTNVTPAPRQRPRVAAAPAYTVTYDLRINFANASDELDAKAKANAEELAKGMKSPELADVRFAIDGHTNAVGNAEYNKDLSLRRANSMVNYLVELGIDPGRLEVNGYGFEKLANPNSPQAPVNRRVEARRLQD
jgi:outer membrane protein OmpA-like peptidoglycan-associated protein